MKCAVSALTLLVGWQVGHLACKKTEWWGAGMVICLERGADLHVAQLMRLPLNVSCFIEIQIGFTFLVPAHPGCPGKRAVKWVYVCVCWHEVAGVDVDRCRRCSHHRYDLRLWRLRWSEPFSVGRELQRMHWALDGRHQHEHSALLRRCLCPQGETLCRCRVGACFDENP